MTNIPVTDQVKLPPIQAKGFGKLAKIVMIDNRLSLEARGLYAYFVSHASKDGECYPKVDTILGQTGLSINTFYKHFAQIKSNDWDSTGKNVVRKVRRLISVELCDKEDTEHGYWQHNVYTLEHSPAMYMDADPMEGTEYWQKAIHSIQEIESIFAAGYGVVPRLVMDDTDISFQSRTVYAYLCTFDAHHSMSHPDMQTMLRQLGISKPCMIKYIKELESKHYITSVRTQPNKPARYVLNEDPSSPVLSPYQTMQKPQLKNCDTVDSTSEALPLRNCDTVKTSANKVPLKNCDTVSLDTASPLLISCDTVDCEAVCCDSVNCETVSCDTADCATVICDTITPVTVKTVDINTRKSQSFHPAQTDGTVSVEDIEKLMEGRIEAETEEELIISEIARGYAIPYSWASDVQKMETAIRVLTEYDFRSKSEYYTPFKENPQLCAAAYRVFVAALTEMLTSRRTPLRNGSMTTYAKVVDSLNEFLQVQEDSFGELSADLGMLPDECVETMVSRILSDGVKNHHQYMKNIIWTKLQEKGIGAMAQVAHDMA